jgi:ArsR family transcriptional regulator
MRPSPVVSVHRGEAAPISHKGAQGDDYQSDDHDFGRIAEDTAGQLLRRTGACGCQCVLCPGRRHEIERRDRVWMLVTNVGGASYHSEVLRVATGRSSRPYVHRDRCCLRPDLLHCSQHMLRASRLPVDRLFRAFSDRTRLRILHLLQEGELCVCDLVSVLRVPQPTASRHLAYLRRAGLVRVRKERCLRTCFSEVPELGRDHARRTKGAIGKCCD